MAETKKDKAPAKEKNNFLGDVKAEFKRIHWPSKKELAQKTGIVIVFSAIFAGIIAVYDVAFTSVIRLIQGIF